MVSNVCVSCVCLVLTLGTAALLAWRVHQGAYVVAEQLGWRDSWCWWWMLPFRCLVSGGLPLAG